MTLKNLNNLKNFKQSTIFVISVVFVGLLNVGLTIFYKLPNKKQNMVTFISVILY